MSKRLSIKANSYHLEVAGRKLLLSPPQPDVMIADSEWLILNAREFVSEEEAREFGATLKTALDVSAVACRIGVDTGRNVPTSALGKIVKDALSRAGTIIRDNIHGLDVFPDHADTRIFNVSGKGTVFAGPDPFLRDLDKLVRLAATPSQRVSDVILLLNYALMRPEPVAQIIFAISAVESLGQDETWSPAQEALLDELAAIAEQQVIGTVDERREVADAVRKSLHRLTLRQGVFRLLGRLGLQHLKRAWDDLYTERSALVHGLAPRPGADYGDLAHRTVSLCGQILLKAIAVEIPQADQHVARMYVV